MKNTKKEPLKNKSNKESELVYIIATTIVAIIAIPLIIYMFFGREIGFYLFPDWTREQIIKKNYTDLKYSQKNNKLPNYSMIKYGKYMTVPGFPDTITCSKTIPELQKGLSNFGYTAPDHFITLYKNSWYITNTSKELVERKKVIELIDSCTKTAIKKIEETNNKIKKNQSSYK